MIRKELTTVEVKEGFEDESMLEALRHHWPEYLIETTGLGTFMISACVFTILLEHPVSPVALSIADPVSKRAVIGIAMGLTAGLRYQVQC